MGDAMHFLEEPAVFADTNALSMEPFYQSQVRVLCGVLLQQLTGPALIEGARELFALWQKARWEAEENLGPVLLPGGGVQIDPTPRAIELDGPDE